MKKSRMSYLFIRKGNILNVKKMKLTFLFSFMVFLSSWGNSYSQETRLSMQMKDVSIQEVISQIEDMTEFYFLYQDNIFKSGQTVTVQSSNATIESILDQLTNQIDIRYEVLDRQIILKEKLRDDLGLMQQNKKNVSGLVTDKDGQSIPGVSIIAKGTTNGTVTDIDGKFSLQVSSTVEVLVFSFVGMEKQEVVLNGKTVVYVTLNSSTIDVDEVVVTALGISRETKSLGYSVSEVKGESLQTVTQENVLNALSGKVSGVTINSTGAAGSSVSMVIRGASSLTSDNQPLFVIDGVPVNNSLNNVSEIGRDNKVDYGNAISDLNSNDIESMSILKGPSAAALYGSRAGNGVVIITTKKGKKGSGLGISVNSSTVFDIPYAYLPNHTLFANGSRPYTPDNYPSNEYGAMIIAEDASGWVGPELDKGYKAIQWPFTQQEIESGIPVARELKSYDNAKNFFETGVTSTNGISLSNQNEKLTYRLSYTNMTNKGYIPNSDLKKNSLSTNASLKLTDNFTVSSAINFTKSGADNRPSGNRGTNPLQALYNINSHINVLDMKEYWEEGKEGLQQKSPYSWGDYESREFDNPYFLANEVNNSFTRNRILGNVTADWEISKDLSLMTRYAHDEFNEHRETKVANSYTREGNGIYGIIKMQRLEQNADFLLTYEKHLDDINFSVSAGGNAMYQRGDNMNTQTKTRGSGLIIPGLYNLSNIAPDNLSYGAIWWEKSIYSVYGLASFGFKDYAYLDVTARNDWSSTLPESSRSFFYPSASLSVLINNMIEMPEDISLMKIRAGWAQVGNDTDPYKLYPVLNNNGAWGNVTQLSVSGQLLTPDLKPEIQTSFEIGTDLAFFNNRLRMDATWYNSENKNQVLGITIPASSGSESKQINSGLISSKGWEASIGGTPISNDDWKLDLNVVLSRNRTTLKELTEGMDYIKLWGDAKGGAYTWVGEEIGQIIDRALVRVDDPSSPYHGWPLLDDEGWDNSDRSLQDENGNRVAPVIGNFNPDLMVGMQANLSYKRFSLSANFDWRIGGQFVSQTLRYGESDLHSQRWIDKTVKTQGISDIPAYLKENAGEYLLPDGEFFVVVGGPNTENGGLPHTEGGISLNDGVFMPGVYGVYDDNGNLIKYQENLGGDGTQYIRYQDYYGWSYTRNATFDADYIKLREISLSYQLPTKLVRSFGVQGASLSLFSRNIILWTKAKVNIDPEMAFQPESSTQTSGIQFKQGIERYNVNPWAIPVGIKLNINL